MSWKQQFENTMDDNPTDLKIMDVADQQKMLCSDTKNRNIKMWRKKMSDLKTTEILKCVNEGQPGKSSKLVLSIIYYSIKDMLILSNYC